MLRILFVTSLIIFLFTDYDSPTSGQDEKAILINIQGVLLVGEFFGPPNYGEHPRSDRIEKSYYLQLPAPIDYQQPKYIVPKELREALDQSHHFIQLVVFTENLSAATRLVGSRVQVSGSLVRAETGHHRTPVLLKARSIQRINRWQW